MKKLEDTLCEVCDNHIDTNYRCKCGFDSCLSHGAICGYCGEVREHTKVKVGAMLRSRSINIHHDSITNIDTNNDIFTTDQRAFSWSQLKRLYKIEGLDF